MIWPTFFFVSPLTGLPMVKPTTSSILEMRPLTLKSLITTRCTASTCKAFSLSLALKSSMKLLLVLH